MSGEGGGLDQNLVKYQRGLSSTSSRSALEKDNSLYLVKIAFKTQVGMHIEGDNIEQD